MRTVTFLGVLLLAMSQEALSATATAKGKVTRVMTDASSFGGCMVLMNVTLADRSLDCRSGWVTFDCNGVSGEVSKSAASRNFESALLAKVTGGRVELLVTDEVKINGWCLGTRATLL